jgi:hypothetical protein
MNVFDRLRRFSLETRILARSFTDPIIKAQMHEIANSMEKLVDDLATRYPDPKHPVIKARMRAVANSLEKLADELEEWYPDQRLSGASPALRKSPVRCGFSMLGGHSAL